MNDIHNVNSKHINHPSDDGNAGLSQENSETIELDISEQNDVHISHH